MNTKTPLNNNQGIGKYITSFNVFYIIVYVCLYVLILTILIPFNPDIQWRHYLMERYEMSQDIVIIGIDDSSLSQFES
jgi:hypothetical protein